MAHPCCECGSECYCSGDIDDTLITRTPKHCTGCGCEEVMIVGPDEDQFEEVFKSSDNE